MGNKSLNPKQSYKIMLIYYKRYYLMIQDTGKYS